MRLVVDARTVRPGRTGVGYSTEWMVRALEHHADAPLELVVLSLPGADWNPPLERARVVTVSTDYESHPAGEWFLNVRLPALLQSLRADLFWGAAFLVPWRRRATPSNVSVQEVSVFTHAGCYPWRIAAYQRQAIRLSVRRATRIVVPSGAVAKALAGIFPDCQPRIRIVPHGVDPAMRPAGLDDPPVPSGLPEPFVLAMGWGNPRKGIGDLVRIWNSDRAGRRLLPDLVVLDAAGSGTAPEQVAPGIWRLPRVGRDTLRGLYSRASLFVMPSVDEGFGFPMLEAMACGCVVVAAEAGSLPELAGDAAVCIDFRADSAAAALAALLGGRDMARLRELGLRRAAEQDWDAAVRQFLQVCGETLVR